MMEVKVQTRTNMTLLKNSFRERIQLLMAGLALQGLEQNGDCGHRSIYSYPVEDVDH